MYDSAKLDRDHLKRLQRAGVHVSIFRPMRWYTLKKLNNRMHRRILCERDARLRRGGGDR